MTKHDPKISKYKGQFSIDYRERRSHARDMHPTQNTSRMGTAREKQEEEADTKIILKKYELWKKGTWAL